MPQIGSARARKGSAAPVGRTLRAWHHHVVQKLGQGRPRRARQARGLNPSGHHKVLARAQPGPWFEPCGAPRLRQVATGARFEPFGAPLCKAIFPAAYQRAKSVAARPGLGVPHTKGKTRRFALPPRTSVRPVGQALARPGVEPGPRSSVRLSAGGEWESGAGAEHLLAPAS